MRTAIIGLALMGSATICAQTVTFERGDFVRVKPATNVSEPTTSLVLRVVAVPNDRIRVDDSTVYVNDAAVTGFSPDFLNRVAHSPERVPQTVPQGHYFVMGEQRTARDISEYWGQHSGVRLEPAR